MSQQGYIEAFQIWLQRSEPKLKASRITTPVPDKPNSSSTYAEFFSEIGEATVEVWDYGYSEFHVADYRAANANPDYQAEVRHYEFQSKEEIDIRLDALIHGLTMSLAPAVALLG